MLLKLCFFHVYLCKKGVTTYDLILARRKNNKVLPDGGLNSKSSPRINISKDEEGNQGRDFDPDDSRDAMNASLNRSYPSHKPIEVNEKEGNDTLQSDVLRDTLHNRTFEKEQSTNIKDKGIFETKEESTEKKDDVKTNVNSQQSVLSNQQEKKAAKLIFKKQLDPLKEDESSFVLSKQPDIEDKKSLALRLEEQPAKLTPPLSESNRKRSEDEEPGEWTLRNQDQFK